MIAGIILAAGDSRRMGSPKALLDYRGETFAARLIRIFEKFCDPVIVVAGRHAAQIRAQIGARVVINPDPDRGQLSSLQTALAELPANIEAFLFTPVDSPAVAESTVAAMIGDFRSSRAPFVIPRFCGKRGHPVLAAGAMTREFLAQLAEAETRAVVNRHENEIRYLDVDDPGILTDVDDPEAYRELVSR